MRPVDVSAFGWLPGALPHGWLGIDEGQVKALVQQVDERDYNPPRRERILEWQAKQEFPICPDADDPDSCNVYQELDLPEHVFAQIQEFREQQFEADES